METGVTLFLEEKFQRGGLAYIRSELKCKPHEKTGEFFMWTILLMVIYTGLVWKKCPYLNSEGLVTVHIGVIPTLQSPETPRCVPISLHDPVWNFFFLIECTSLTYLHGEWPISHYAANIWIHPVSHQAPCCFKRMQLKWNFWCTLWIGVLRGYFYY